MAKKINVAFLYDFDKTLIDRDMQEYSFIPALGLTPKDFWSKSNEIADTCKMERILSYMYLMVTECKKKNIPLTRQFLQECGKNVIMYKGVETWFDRINKFADELGVNIEHYVLSSGTKEIIEGTKIADKFVKLYGCEFHYDENGIADWPLNSVNYTTKTQYIYRISKGILDITDDVNLNSKMQKEDRHIQMKNMVYFGDGLTDVPCMKLMKESGGKAIAVYQPGNLSKASALLLEGRCDYLTKADYSQGSELENIAKILIEKISLENDLEGKYHKMIKNATKAVQEKQ